VRTRNARESGGTAASSGASARAASVEPRLAGGRWLPGPSLFRRLHAAGRSIPIVLEFEDPGLDALDVLAALGGGAVALGGGTTAFAGGTAVLASAITPRPTSVRQCGIAPEGAIVYLLESAGGPADLDRRTFLAWEPEREYVLHRGWLETWSQGERTARVRCRRPLEDLRAVLGAEGAAPMPHADGFSGGLVGYVAYDFKNFLERLPDSVHDDLGIPELRLGLVRRVLSWDHRAGTLQVRYSGRCTADPRRDLTRAYDEVLNLHGRLQDAAAAGSAAGAGAASGAGVGRDPAAGARRPPTRSNMSRDGYDRMLARAHKHILAGDIYQANLSQRFEAPFRGGGLDLYRRLRTINPSPFATYLRFPEHEVVSCSPERLVRLAHGRVETRPIAGTRPRGADRAADRRLQRELLGDDKERAEHLMIVDMARNDIGRVCAAGSVGVERFMRVERYSHVRHLVSNVAGRLRPDRDALDLLAATFPGASITGVPKVRCMQIIDELESVRRGVYTGSAGYIGLDGAMDFNILIRTFLLQGGRAYFHVGGGIVADSDAGREYEETLAKGRALEEALLAAERTGGASVDA